MLDLSLNDKCIYIYILKKQKKNKNKNKIKKSIYRLDHQRICREGLDTTTVDLYSYASIN